MQPGMHYVVYELHFDRPATFYGWTIRAEDAVQWVSDLALAGRRGSIATEVTLR